MTPVLNAMLNAKRDLVNDLLLDEPPDALSNFLRKTKTEKTSSRSSAASQTLTADTNSPHHNTSALKITTSKASGSSTKPA